MDIKSNERYDSVHLTHIFCFLTLTQQKIFLRKEKNYTKKMAWYIIAKWSTLFP